MKWISRPDTWILCLMALTIGCNAKFELKSKININPEAKLVGKWKGNVQVQLPKDENPLGQLANEIAEKIAENMEVHQEFKSDGTFKVVLGKLEGNGTWRVIDSNGDSITIESKTEDQTEPIRTTYVFQGNDTYSFSPENDKEKTLTFVREK